MHRVDKNFGVKAWAGKALLGAACSLLLAGCGNTYRPVVSSINPVGPAAQPTKYAVVAVTTGANSPGLVNIVDVSGDDVLVTAMLGANPRYLNLNPGGNQGYTLNGDGTFNTFGISVGLLTSDVLQSTLLAGAQPASVLSQGNFLYIAEPGRNAVAELQGTPPALRQELPTGAGTIYTVGVNGAPRVYAISPGVAGATGTVAAIETSSNTVTNTIPVGRGPVYGVMTGDARRAFILNKTDGTVSVINAQTNAPDTFTGSRGAVTSTIPVGAGPIWADLVPNRSELVVANAGDGVSAGSVTIVNIPLCSAGAIVSNPNCDAANPVDATGFGQVLANIPVGINPVMVAVMQDGTRAYVANAGNATTPGSVSVINLDTNTVTTTIAASQSVNQADAFIHGHPNTIAVTTGTPTGKVYVTAPDSTDLTVIRTDTDTVQTHLGMQGLGVQVRVSSP